MAVKSGPKRVPRLKTLREAHGLSQAALAARAGVSQAMISKLETGENEPKGLRTALAVAAVLAVEVTAIWPAASPHPRPQHRPKTGRASQQEAAPPSRKLA